MPAAATPEPTEAKAALRPRRVLIPFGPTRPRLIAAITGPSTQLAPACKIREAKTTTKIGDTASANALNSHSGDGHRRHPALRARGVDNRAARDLTDQADDSASRQDKADIGLSPFFSGQIDGYEGAKSGLHVRQKKDEPVEGPAARKGRKRRARRLAIAGRRRRRQSDCVATRFPFRRSGS